MPIYMIDVPLGFLLDRTLTPAAKLLWIVFHIDAERRRKASHRPMHLARRTGLARSTVHLALKQLSASGWIRLQRKHPFGKRRWLAVRPPAATTIGSSADRSVGDTYVKIPVDLVDLSDAPAGVRPQAILCFGLMQAVPRATKGPGGWFKGSTGWFKWAELSQASGLHVKTLKRAVGALVAAGWVTTVQKNRVASIRYKLQHADEARIEAIQKRLDEADHVGQELMRVTLDVITTDTQPWDGAKPQDLVNSSSGERLEIDRLCLKHHAALEFNGRQHYEATGRFTKQEVAAQKRRDAIKRRYCRENDITLVVVHAEDLSIEGMLKKVGNLLPLRDPQNPQVPRGYERTVRYLEAVCRGYRKRAAQAAARDADRRRA